MHDERHHALRVEARGQRLGDGDRAVLTARAADREGDVPPPLALIPVAHVPEALDEFPQADILGADAVHRRNRAVQDVVKALVLARSFESGNVARVLDDAQDAPVPGRGGTHRALLAVGQVATAVSYTHLTLPTIYPV